MKKTATPPANTTEKKVMSIDEAAYIAWINEKKEQFENWLAGSRIGKIADDVNPAFTFQMTHKEILVKIISGEVSPTFLASMELANRGCDKAGNWVGFDEAQKIHFGSTTVKYF